MKKRLLSILTCLALCLTLLPVTAAAADLTKLYVGSTVVVNSSGTGTTSGEGWSYDGNGTLTLNGANITTGYNDAGIYAEGNLTIQLVGENTVDLSSSDNSSAGIVASGSLTIQGSGTLTAKGTLYGIAGESVAIKENAQVTATANSDSGGVAIAIYGNSKVVITGSAQVYAEGRNAGIGAGIGADSASVEISGGSVTLSAQGDGGSAIGVGGSGSASVEITGGSVALSAQGDGGSAIGFGGNGNNSLQLTGGNTVITSGTTLDLTDVGTSGIDFDTLTNNGTLVLPYGYDSTDIAALKLGGAGLVKVDGDSNLYSNSGTKPTTECGPIVVSTNAADKDHWTLPSGPAKCTWAQDTNGVWTLTLNGVYVQRNITIDAKGADKIVIDVLGDSVVDGTAGLEQNSLTAGTAGAVTRYGLTGGAVETYAFPDASEFPGIIVENAGGCILTLKGSGLLTVLGGSISLDSGNKNVLYVAQGARVGVSGGRVSAGQSGGVDGTVQVDGTLWVDTTGTAEDWAVFTGRTEIGAAGTLNVTGQGGLYLNGMLDGSSQWTFADSLVLRPGGWLVANCTVAAVEICDAYGSGVWPDDPDLVIVGLPSEVSAKWCDGESSDRYCSITNPGVTLSYADGLSGALKTLDIIGSAGGGTTVLPVLPDDGWDASDDDDEEPSYTVILRTGEGGSLHTTHRAAEAGTEVVLTITPDQGHSLHTLTVTNQRTGGAVDLENLGGGRYAFEMPAGAVLVETRFTQGEQAEVAFADVPEDYWAYSEIAWAYESGYMSGVSADAFNPGGTVTRQQVWMILARMSGAAPADMAAARAWAVANGVSDGTSPGGAVTRQQLVALLYRFAAQNGYNVSNKADLSGYPDAASVSGYASDAMAWAVANGIIGGTTAGTLNAAGNSNRAQLSVILWRFYQTTAG